ncbi:MAG: response regulator [Methylococcales bacterium]|jgi:CheY-like chemotaxis protein|nr:response regulator [Methylococcales bacterium]MBT7410170.1 response regulator [Methylococcales bacterium]
MANTELAITEVMIVDDEQTVRMTLKAVLQRLGVIKIYEEKSGEKAVAQLKSVAPQLVLLDINMEGMTGLETLKAIKKENKDIIVVMISGDAVLDNIKKALELGAKDFIAKPFVPKKVVERLSKLLKTGK